LPSFGVFTAADRFDRRPAAAGATECKNRRGWS
jgi:hypothetical protein